MLIKKLKNQWKNFKKGPPQQGIEPGPPAWKSDAFPLDHDFSIGASVDPFILLDVS